MVEVRGLVKSFGLKPVLRGVDLTADTGEFVGLVGPNGAGKTTFLRILSSLARPTAGAVRIGGYPLPGAEIETRRLLGVVAHRPMLYGDLTADENLRFYGRMYGVAELEARVGGLLEQVGLEAVRGERVRSFSRGMQQRLAIARGILHQPSLLLLDEPHTGLDQEAAAMLDELLLEVAAEGRTLLMTSHDLSRAHRLSTRVDVLANGRIGASLITDGLPLADLTRTYERVTHV